MGNSSSELDGRVALVTGADGGIGRVTCASLRELGATVVGVDQHGEDCLQIDVGSEAGAKEMVASTVAEHGRLDILVLNAGIQHIAPISSFPLDEWDRLLNVMLRGPFIAIQQAWDYLTATPGGRIVVTGSATSVLGETHKAAYVAAKHGVLGLVKVAALEGGPVGLTANAVGPGWVRTTIVERQLADLMELHGLSRQAMLERMVSRHPIKRFVEPREVADTIAFLASPRASAINGQLISVDLGTVIAW
jgi:3-hydroxybutyrate dehydrogenase